MALAPTLQSNEEFCPSCGSWVDESRFNFDYGWCIECTPVTDAQTCNRCGSALLDKTRTTCPTCRLEHWYELYADEVEYFIVAKGYTLYQTRQRIAKMVRPICQCCGKPIKGGAASSIFCKRNKQCRSAAIKYRRLLKSGLTNEQARDIIRGRTTGR